MCPYCHAFAKTFFSYFYCSGNEWESGFRTGAVLALVLFLLLYLLLLLFRFLLFRRKRVRQIVCNGPSGTYVIASGAVLDLLSGIAARFSEISLRKVLFYHGKKGKYQLELYIIYHPSPDSATVPELVSRVEDAVRSALEHSFGITGVETVMIRIVRTKTPKKSISL